MEVYDTAASVLKELVDTGQNSQRQIEQLVREKTELVTEYDKMKSDFFYNLDIIKGQWAQMLVFIMNKEFLNLSIYHRIKPSSQ